MNLITGSLMVLFLIGFSQCGEYVVIVNKDNSLTSVSATDLKRLYTGKLTGIEKVKLEAGNLTLSDPVAASFLSEIVGMSVSDYKSFWLAEQIRGGSNAPVVKKTIDAMIEFVKESPAGLGYIPKSAVTDGVKTITIK